MKNILVTGSTGFVGSHFCRRLRGEGHNVITLPRFSNIKDMDCLKSVFSSQSLDFIWHLAGKSSVEACQKDAKEAFETNLAGTWNMMELALDKKVKGFFLASTDRVSGYGMATDVGPVPLIYDVSKHCAEEIALSYYHNYRLPVSVVRLSSIFGSEDWNDGKLIPGTIQALLNREYPKIKSPGNTARNYIYINDVVDAFSFLMSRFDQLELAGGRFQVGYEKPITIKSLVDKLVRISGHREYYPKEVDAVDEDAIPLPSSQIKSVIELGWMPKYTLDEALEETFYAYRDMKSACN